MVQGSGNDDGVGSGPGNVGGSAKREKAKKEVGNRVDIPGRGKNGSDEALESAMECQ